LSALMGARLAGCHPVVAVDIVPAKLELALELGATHAVRGDDPDLVATIRKPTRGGSPRCVPSATVPPKGELPPERGATHAVRGDDPALVAPIRELTGGGGE